MLDISVRTDISSIPSGWRERRCAQVDIEYRGVAMVLVDNQVVSLLRGVGEWLVGMRLSAHRRR